MDIFKKIIIFLKKIIGLNKNKSKKENIQKQEAPNNTRKEKKDMSERREEWYIKNITPKTSIVIGDLISIPEIRPGKQVDILNFHKREDINNSINLRSLFLSGKLSLIKIKDGQSFTYIGEEAVRAISFAEELDSFSSSSGGGYIDRGELSISSSSITINQQGLNAELFTVDASEDFTINISGTSTARKIILLKIEESKVGGGLVITAGSNIRAINQEISTTGLENSTTYVKFIYNLEQSKWDVIGNINLI